MDQRLFLEFLPGIVFLFVNAVGDLFVATAAALVAAVFVVYARYQIDRQLPFLAIATVSLSVLMLGFGMAFDDEQFIKMRPTIGALAFAMMLVVGSMLQPSLLQRSLGYKIILVPAGWRMLHLAWICLALMLALLNEVVWRQMSTDFWVVYKTAVGPVTFALYWGVTWAISWEYWDEDEDDD